MSASSAMEPVVVVELPTIGLDLHHLSVVYGGHRAVTDVSLSAPVGRITGLIGPNGAGKTTIFNASSGLVRPSAGKIQLFGTDVTRRNPAARARMGMGRTFQRTELVGAMSVAANVALGAECRIVRSNPLRQLLASPAQRRLIADAADGALETCGITGLAHRAAGTLSTGQRRLVELARGLAGGFRLLLLDEPSSGLDDEETFRFGEILQLVVADGVGILLVEHDMPLVMRICEEIFVVDFGHLIFHGSPLETQASDLVRKAYLGIEAMDAPA